MRAPFGVDPEFHAVFDAIRPPADSDKGLVAADGGNPCERHHPRLALANKESDGQEAASGNCDNK